MLIISLQKLIKFRDAHATAVLATQGTADSPDVPYALWEPVYHTVRISFFSSSVPRKLKLKFVTKHLCLAR